MAIYIAKEALDDNDDMYFFGRTTLDKRHLLLWLKQSKSYILPEISYFQIHNQYKKIHDEILFRFTEYTVRDNWLNISLTQLLDALDTLNSSHEKLSLKTKNEIKHIMRNNKDYEISCYDIMNWFNLDCTGNYLKQTRLEILFRVKSGLHGLKEGKLEHIHSTEKKSGSDCHYVIHRNGLMIDTPMFSNLGFRALSYVMEYGSKKDMIQYLNTIK